MTVTSSASFRDPENAAFEREGIWYRIAAPSSAVALRTLRSSAVYAALTADGRLVAFDEVTDGAAAMIRGAYASTSGRPVADDFAVFRVDSVDLISYPWEWPNSLLEAAALLTLDLRRRLLERGLDLKDAAAGNIAFRGTQPVLVDLGSIERWRPNPGWNATRQFVEQFVNPLAVGAQEHLSSADAWELGHRRGLRSDVARAAMPKRLRRKLGLTALQASTRPKEGNAPAETKYAQQAASNPELAKRATLGLTRNLGKRIDELERAAGRHATTWADYGTRDHYGSADLELKAQRSIDFAKRAIGGVEDPLVLDIGGNDGMTALAITRATGARAIVMDADAGALDVLCGRLAASGNAAGGEASRITPLIGDLTNLTTGSGLLGREWQAATDRIRPDAVLCQAVLHHVVITQGTPMQLAVDALAAFGAPLQVEFATPEDEKVRLLLSPLPNWSGEYDIEALVEAMRRRYSSVEVVGTTSPTRVVVEATGPLA